jgi:hypothetical protein
VGANAVTRGSSFYAARIEGHHLNQHPGKEACRPHDRGRVQGDGVSTRCGVRYAMGLTQVWIGTFSRTRQQGKLPKSSVETTGDSRSTPKADQKGNGEMDPSQTSPSFLAPRSLVGRRIERRRSATCKVGSMAPRDRRSNIPRSDQPRDGAQSPRR